jgi:hypothetical protein
VGHHLLLQMLLEVLMLEVGNHLLLQMLLEVLMLHLLEIELSFWVSSEKN